MAYSRRDDHIPDRAAQGTGHRRSMAVTEQQIDTAIAHPQQRSELATYGRYFQRLIQMCMANAERGRLQGKALIAATGLNPVR
ncbi:MAG TPA: hypothetical protein DCY47_09685, partial [Candidatus Accumulibacter sp.]|nr:hypothetical protein [Accumulibacter sp.]